jgi:hypothetical protein
MLFVLPKMVIGSGNFQLVISVDLPSNIYDFHPNY